MAAAIAAAASLRCLGVKKASSRGSNLHAREWPKTRCLFFYKETAFVPTCFRTHKSWPQHSHKASCQQRFGQQGGTSH